VAVAQEAAKALADDLAGINLGLVSFSGTASVLVAPTTGVKMIIAELQLQLSDRTAPPRRILRRR
jgi:Ca-activated chloride channel family protein